MKPDISEFSYGYALTEELIRNLGPVVSAPRFPSLIAEGKIGYDLALDFQFLGSLFLQFKLSDRMVRDTAMEINRPQPVFTTGTRFFRMHLRPRRTSRQHDLLCDLEAKGERVYYAAPEFDSPEELTSAYLSRTIVTQSAFFRPGDIGRFNDSEQHHVAFEARASCGWVFSEPRKIDLRRATSDTAIELFRTTQQRGTSRTVREELVRLSRQMMEELPSESPTAEFDDLRGRFSLAPEALALYLASHYYNCDLLILSKRLPN